MTRSVPVGEVRLLGDRAFLIGVADAAAGRVLARVLETSLDGAPERGVRCGHCHGRRRPTPTPTSGARARRRRRSCSRKGPPALTRDAVAPGRLVTVPCRIRRAGPRLRWPRWRGCRPDDVAGLLTAGPLTVSRGRVLAGFRLSRRASRNAWRRAPAAEPAPGGAGRIGGDRQRPCRRLSHRLPGGLAPGRPDRFPPVLARAPALRRRWRREIGSASPWPGPTRPPRRAR